MCALHRSTGQSRPGSLPLFRQRRRRHVGNPRKKPPSGLFLRARGAPRSFRRRLSDRGSEALSLLPGRHHRSRNRGKRPQSEYLCPGGYFPRMADACHSCRSPVPMAKRTLQPKGGYPAALPGPWRILRGGGRFLLSAHRQDGSGKQYCHERQERHQTAQAGSHCFHFPSFYTA